jgi:hypothetical protein
MGLYIGKYLPRGWGISAGVIWGKNTKRAREKRGKCKRKREAREGKRKKGEEKYKLGSKKVK